MKLMREWLTDWEMSAVQTGIERMLESGAIHQEHGQQLLAKLERAINLQLLWDDALVHRTRKAP